MIWGVGAKCTHHRESTPRGPNRKHLHSTKPVGGNARATAIQYTQPHPLSPHIPARRLYIYLSTAALQICTHSAAAF